MLLPGIDGPSQYPLQPSSPAFNHVEPLMYFLQHPKLSQAFCIFLIFIYNYTHFLVLIFSCFESQGRGISVQEDELIYPLFPALFICFFSYVFVHVPLPQTVVNVLKLDLTMGYSQLL